MMPKITINVSISAPLQKVWDCWTDATHILHWNFASDDWHCPEASNTLVVGGTFSSTMSSKDGAMSFEFEGTYTHISFLKHIAYQLTDGRVVEIHFEQNGTQVVITESFDPETENPLEMQRAGWQAILNHFKQYVESI